MYQVDKEEEISSDLEKEDIGMGLKTGEISNDNHLKQQLIVNRQQKEIEVILYILVIPKKILV